MSERSCKGCGAQPGLREPFCPCCGRRLEEPPALAPDGPRVHRFGCRGCGAAMVFGAVERALVCPFCGGSRLVEQEVQAAPEAQGVPFEVDEQGAAEALKGWLRGRFWSPVDLVRCARLGVAWSVHLPAWIFSARVETCWTADSSRVPRGSEGSWAPVAGQRRGEHRDLYVPASPALDQAEVSALLPFHPERRSGRGGLEPMAVESFGLARSGARRRVQALLVDRERRECRRLVPGRARNLKVSVRVRGESARPALLPVWILAYRYRDKVYRILVNGQTGKVCGQAPISPWKLGLALALVGGLVAALTRWAGLWPT